MALIDRERDLETLNRKALRLAREVADKTNTLMAGNICNTNIYNPDDSSTLARIDAIFKVGPRHTLLRCASTATVIIQ